MFHIIQHDGPARIGKLNGSTTPDVIPSSSSLKVIKDEPMPYDIPLELAQWAVNKTINYAKDENKEHMAVIHGGKYVDLRVECARKLNELGYKSFLIANSWNLLKNPRDLVNIVINIKKTVNPNTVLYFPFADLSFIPLLSYMGIDLFGEITAEYYAYLNIMLTPDAQYNLKEYNMANTSSLNEINKKNMEFVLNEVRENIKNNTLRNLVERRCCSTPESMSALRLLDKYHFDFLDRYTPLY